MASLIRRTLTVVRAPPPDPPEELARDAVARALRHRPLYFGLILGAIVLIIGPSAPVLGGAIDDPSRPDLMTAIFAGAAVLEGIVLVFFAFVPRRTVKAIRRSSDRRGTPVTLSSVGSVTTLFAAAFAAAPILCGFSLLAVSGQVWRLLLFIPIAAVMGWGLWWRVGQIVEESARQGIA